MFYDTMARLKLNTALNEKECGLPPFGRAEKKALKQAERAEREFRRSRGYAPDSWWQKMKDRLRK